MPFRTRHSQCIFLTLSGLATVRMESKWVRTGEPGGKEPGNPEGMMKEAGYQSRLYRITI